MNDIVVGEVFDHRTHNPEVIIPSLCKIALDLYPDWYHDWRKDEVNSNVLNMIEEFDTVCGREETAWYLIDELETKINEAAPDGYYFGTRCDGGSEYGWFPISDEFVNDTLEGVLYGYNGA